LLLQEIQGAAAIDAIKGKKNINIFVLHPNNRISPVQRKLMTTGKEKNVFNIAVEGSFDDCQNLVKAMFTDKNFANEIKMSGVNSINWARIIAQSVYYFYSYFLVEIIRSQ
jgi:threonine synthase